MNIRILKYNLSSHILSPLFVMVAAAGLLTLPSCSTGIESTKTIKMSKDDIRRLEKTEEQKFAARISPYPLAKWEPGKRFLALTDRALYIFDSCSAQPATIEGKILTYVGREVKISPDLNEQCVLVFSDGDITYRYNTGKTPEEALTEIDSNRIPLLADLDMIDSWKRVLVGKTLWTRSNLWYDGDGQRKNGLKFTRVSAQDVLPAVGEFPMKVKIANETDTAFLFMNYTSDIADSRNFAALFFLSDPKQKYPDITAENWNLIKAGKVGKGMTKEECRLALGNPDDLRSGHSTSQTLDVWQYSNGTYLFFSDGLLNSFRQ